MRFESPDGSVIEGREALCFIEWRKKKREEEWKKRARESARASKKLNKPKAKGQEFQLVCENGHESTVTAYEINEPYCFCGGRLKLQ